MVFQPVRIDPDAKHVFSKENQAVSSFAIEDHVQLLDAIRQKDEARAQELLIIHINKARSKVLAGFVQYMK